MTAMRLFILMLCFSLTACGFHLRGSYNIPSTIKHLELKLDTNSALYFPLRDALQQASIQLDASDYTLEILEDSLNKQTTNTDSRAKAAEYTLYYTVVYHLKNNETKTIYPERRLLLRRSYQYDTTAIVGKTAEEETLIRELYQDAAQQILRQLSSFQPTQPTLVKP
jgi:LPS-assembly lipoprotein